MNIDQSCGTFARALAARLGRKVAVVSAGKTLPAGDAVVLTLSQPRSNAVSASLQGRVNGRPVVSGPLTLDVMDRNMRQADVDKLAELLARSLKSG